MRGMHERVIGEMSARRGESDGVRTVVACGFQAGNYTQQHNTNFPTSFTY